MERKLIADRSYSFIQTDCCLDSSLRHRETEMIGEMMASIRSRKSVPKAELVSKPANSAEVCEEDVQSVLAPEVHFRKVLLIERKRAERSERRFVLMLVHAGRLLPAEGRIVKRIAQAVSLSTRETDLAGWYSHGSVVGVLCTEIGEGDLRSILSALHSKVSAAISSRLGPEQTKSMSISFRVFPEELDLDQDQRPVKALQTPASPAAWPKKSPEYAVAGSPTL